LNENSFSMSLANLVLMVSPALGFIPFLSQQLFEYQLMVSSMVILIAREE